jgi:hypothetical protein
MVRIRSNMMTAETVSIRIRLRRIDRLNRSSSTLRIFGEGYGRAWVNEGNPSKSLSCEICETSVFSCDKRVEVSAGNAASSSTSTSDIGCGSFSTSSSDTGPTKRT